MEFEKLTDEERALWEEFSHSEYVPDNEWGLTEEQHAALTNVMGSTAAEDFDWLVDYVAQNIVLIAQCMKNPFFASCLRRAYESGVANDHGPCCCNLGNMFHNTKNEGTAEEYATAIALYEKGASLGDAQASVNLGYIYYYGRGTAVDYVKAYECYALATLIDDNTEGYCKLGDLYASGKGVAQNDWIAWTLYTKAYDLGGSAEQRCRVAHHIADYLMKGIGNKVEKDPDMALVLYSQAEVGYHVAIDGGLTYYEGCLRQAVEGQARAREAMVEKHRRIREGE